MADTVKMRPREYIKIRGANEHNLKSLDVDIPRNEFVVLTGLSGSGKSSLAFDTIYAEGAEKVYGISVFLCKAVFGADGETQCGKDRWFVSRDFHRPEVHEPQSPFYRGNGDGDLRLFPSALCQSRNPPTAQNAEKEIKKQTVDQMVDQIMSLEEGTRIQLLAPVVRGRKGEHAKVFERAKRSGYVRVRVDGSLYELSEEIKLDKNIKHNIESGGGPSGSKGRHCAPPDRFRGECAGAGGRAFRS